MEVECQICYKKLQCINNMHLKTHNLSYNEYKNLFPNSIMFTIETKELISKNRTKLLGENNPFFGKHHTQETKDKISKANKGKLIGDKNPNNRPEVREKKSKKAMGHKCPKDIRNKIGNANRGINNGMYGKHHSEETRQKMSMMIKGKNKGKHRTEETKRKLSDRAKGENNPNFNNWASREPYCKKWAEELREKIRNRYNRKCYVCGKDEKDNIVSFRKIRRLSVHHIDMDKEQGCNGKGWKLVPLCMKCHGLSHNIEMQNYIKNKLEKELNEYK